MSDDRYDEVKESAIVPGREERIGTHGGRRSSRQPRQRSVWPLYLLMALLIAALVAMALQYWQDRQQLTHRLEQIAQQNDQRSNISSNLRRMTDDLARQLDEQHQQLSTLAASLQAQPDISIERISRLEQRLEGIEAASRLRGDTLQAVQQSMASLDQSIGQLRDIEDGRFKGTQSRLDAQQQRLTSLGDGASARDRQLDALADRLTKQQSTLTALMQNDDAEARLSSLAKRLEALSAQNEALHERLGDLRDRQTALAATQASLQGLLSGSGVEADS